MRFQIQMKEEVGPVILIQYSTVVERITETKRQRDRMGMKQQKNRVRETDAFETDAGSE